MIPMKILVTGGAGFIASNITDAYIKLGHKVVVVDNLSSGKKTVSGSIDVKTLGLDPKVNYISADGPGTVARGRYQLSVELPPWGAQAGEFRAQ